MNEKIAFLNPVKNSFLPLPRNATQSLEHEPSIKDFNIIKQLGIGSFRQVYLASHKKQKYNMPLNQLISIFRKIWKKKPILFVKLKLCIN